MREVNPFRFIACQLYDINVFVSTTHLFNLSFYNTNRDQPSFKGQFIKGLAKLYTLTDDGSVKQLIYTTLQTTLSAM